MERDIGHKWSPSVTDSLQARPIAIEVHVVPDSTACRAQPDLRSEREKRARRRQRAKVERHVAPRMQARDQR
jgi:hypothetical protein